MHAVVMFAFLVSVGGIVEGRKIEILCTANCRCDVFEGLRRATCEHGTMLNVKDNVPPETEILEFSYNYVTELRKQELNKNGLSSLKLANFSHNRIKDIHIYSFENLDKLKTLDLSFNALQYVLSEWFWSLRSLEELYLNNNNLGNLKEGPMFESSSLKILNLANCQIPHMYKMSLSEIPNLEQLDISGNYIVQFSSDIIEHHTNLTKLKIKGNKMACDDVGLDLIMFTKENGINIDENYCQKSEPMIKKNEKFQKMTNQLNEGKNMWIFEAKDDMATDEINCNGTTVLQKSVLIEIIEISPVVTVIILLTTGFLFGLIIGCTCEIKNCKVKCPEIKRHHRNSRRFIHRTYSITSRRGIPDGFADSLIVNIDNNMESTPMVERKNVVK